MEEQFWVNKLMPALKVDSLITSLPTDDKHTHKYVIKTILIKITIMIVLSFKLDSLASSHPVSMPVQDPKEIEAIFDTISYKKVVII